MGSSQSARRQLGSNKNDRERWQGNVHATNNVQRHTFGTLSPFLTAAAAAATAGRICGTLLP
jgi:hypothetical protein